MSLNLTEIREALAAAVELAVNSTDRECNVYAYPPDSPQLPAILVLPNPFEAGAYVSYYHSYGGPMCHIGLRLEVRVGGNEIDSARTMDAHLSDIGPSIVTALAADPTLDGVIETLKMAGASVPDRFAASEAEATRTWLAASIPLEVYARRTQA